MKRSLQYLHPCQGGYDPSPGCLKFKRNSSIVLKSVTVPSQEILQQITQHKNVIFILDSNAKTNNRDILCSLVSFEDVGRQIYVCMDRARLAVSCLFANLATCCSFM